MQIQPFRSPTLPPATATNAIIIGETERWLIDPAPTRADERERLAAWARTAMDTEGLTGIALTHHHRDHAGAAGWLAETLDLPLAAHADTARLSPVAGLPVTRILGDGDVLCDDWRVLHTPSHASDHLCFVSSAARVAVVGDMVASVGTIVVDPPDGHMATYIAQLARLATLDLAQAIPAHGDPIDAPSHHFEAYIAHRRLREARVRDALRDAPATLAAVTAASYPELDRRLLPLAERACLAHLEDLFEQGHAAWEGEGNMRSEVPDNSRVWLDPRILWRTRR